jgi:uncharacterized membrane protein YbhN (UPF0104 family)
VPAAFPLAAGGFLEAAGEFFSSLGGLALGPLLIGLACFGIYLSIRSRAYFNVLRAAFPDAPIQWRRIWGAYVAAYGFNNVVPARGGDVMKVFLVKGSVPGSTYPAVTSSMFVEVTFDLIIGGSALIFAMTQGAFPKPPDFADLGAADLSFFAAHPRFTLFFITALGVLVLLLFALLSARVRAFWQRVRQGLTILFDRRRWFREVFLVLLVGWLFRFAAFWMLLEAFHVGGSVRNVVLVLGVNAIASSVPFTPGGAGVVQALIIKVFSGTASTAVVTAYSVGQQIAIAAFSFALGFIAIFFVFRFRSFREVIAAGRAERATAA